MASAAPETSNEGVVAFPWLGRCLARGEDVELPGPVGERNLYALHLRGLIELRPKTKAGLLSQLDAALEAGNRVRIIAPPELLAAIPENARSSPVAGGEPSAVLIEGEGAEIIAAACEIVQRPGPIAVVQAGTTEWPQDLLVNEVSTSILTTAGCFTPRFWAICSWLRRANSRTP